MCLVPEMRDVPHDDVLPVYVLTVDMFPQLVIVRSAERSAEILRAVVQGDCDVHPGEPVASAVERPLGDQVAPAGAFSQRRPKVVTYMDGRQLTGSGDPARS